MSEYIYEEIVDEIIINGFDCSTVRIGEQREEIIRGRDCVLFDRCPMRRGDGSCFCWQGEREDA